MNQETITIVHCTANATIAKEIAHQLAASEFDFDFLACGGDLPLAQAVAAVSGKIILLISDNFLKSSKCMKEGLNFLQRLINSGRTLPLVIDGQYPAENGNGMITVPTKFERVSSVIKYMNHWQEEYLDMRKKKRSVPANEEEAFNEQLKIVRTISSEVGEFLRFLRDSYHCDYPTFSNDHFQVFFQKFTSEDSYKNYITAVGDNPPVSILGTGLGAAVVATAAAKAIPAKEEVIEPVEPEPVEEVVNEIVPEVATPAEPALPVSEVAPETEIDSIVDEILEEEKEQNQIASPEAEIPSETELLAQELALNLPETGIEVPNSSEPEAALIDVETALEDLAKVQTEKEEAIMQDGLEMLGVTAGAVAAGTLVAKATEEQEEAKIIEPADTTLGESDLLRASHDLVQEGKTAEGLALLKNHLATNPDMVAARYQYAVFLAQYQQDYATASSQLQEILSREPNNLPANFFLGELAEAQGEFLEAREYYEKVESINTNFPNLNYKFGLLLSRRFKNSAVLAGNYFEKAYQLNPRNTDALYQLGLVQNESLSQSAEAITAFEKVLSKQPDHPFVNYDLALANYKLGNRETALDFYEKACVNNPELKTPENDLAFALPADFVTSVNGQSNGASAVEMVPVATLTSAAAVSTVNGTVNKAPQSVRTEEVPDYTLDLTSNEPEAEVLLEDLIIQDKEAKALPLKKNEIADEEQIEAAFDAHIGALGAAGLGIAAGAVIEEQVNITSTESPTVEVPKKQQILKKQPKVISTSESTIAINQTTKQPTNVVLITGATSGIGRATAAIFAEKGYDLILTGRRFSRLFKLKEEFESQYSANIQLLPFDIRSASAVQSAIDELPAAWKNVDILINNAGLALGFEPIHEGKLEDWETMIDTNIKGLLYMTRAISPYMVKRKRGHILNISSIAGKEVYPNGNVYCASKHAVEALTKAMRIDLHQYNIRVSQVAPGHVEATEFAQVRFHGDKERAKIYEDFVPVNSRDIAEIIHFITTRPAHVNIQDVLVMGTQQASATITDRSGRE